MFDQMLNAAVDSNANKEEVYELLIAISVISKRLAKKVRKEIEAGDSLTDN